MQSYRVETTITEQGTLLIHGVPYPPGDHVEVVIRKVENIPPGGTKYPLRGTFYEFDQPFESVVQR